MEKTEGVGDGQRVLNPATGGWGESTGMKLGQTHSPPPSPLRLEYRRSYHPIFLALDFPPSSPERSVITPSASLSLLSMEGYC